MPRDPVNQMTKALAVLRRNGLTRLSEFRWADDTDSLPSKSQLCRILNDARIRTSAGGVRGVPHDVRSMPVPA
jgi:hypothetical protein